jgi:hypothetical protein
MKITIALLAVISVASAVPASAAPKTAPKAVPATTAQIVAGVTKMENDGVKADLAGDKSWTEKNLADNWMGCDSSGKWFTKADLLKMIADTTNNSYKSETISDLKVRVYGATAVATYTDTYDAVVGGEHRVRTILATDVFVKMGASWKAVTGHSTTLGK